SKTLNDVRKGTAYPPGCPRLGREEKKCLGWSCSSLSAWMHARGASIRSLAHKDQVRRRVVRVGSIPGQISARRGEFCTGHVGSTQRPNARPTSAFEPPPNDVESDF